MRRNRDRHRDGVCPLRDGVFCIKGAGSFTRRLLSLLLLPLLLVRGLPEPAFALSFRALDSVPQLAETPYTASLCSNSPRSDALGLYYLRARYLNAANGRFWTQDSYEGQTRDPRSLHKLLYANADPANLADPSGLAADPTDFLFDGILVHRSIAADFIGGKIGPGLRLANYVPIGGIINRSSRRTDNSDTYLLSIGDLGLKPDLVDLETREVWEIKTTRGYAIGLADLALYISILNGARDRNSPPWTVGTSYSPPSTARGFRRTANVYPALAGVITYDPYISDDSLAATAGAIAAGLAEKAAAAAFASLEASFGTAVLLRY